MSHTIINNPQRTQRTKSLSISISVPSKLKARNQEFFKGRAVFLELGHFGKNSPTARERKSTQGKNFRFLRLETLKNFILNEQFYP